MSLQAFAPAKINLFLHVGPPGAGGRHPVCSLAVFADVGDTIFAEPASAPSLVVEGPFRGDVGPDADNLITRALALAGAPPIAVRLIKRLPAASGLGGGSSDAGAALRLAGRLFPDIGSERIETAARRLGADGLMCLRARACIAEGEGEILSEAPELPVLHGVLINPGVPSPTGAVYRAYDDGPLADAARPPMPARFETAEAVWRFLETCRNDLEAPACGLAPGIADLLGWMRAQPTARFVRMSGSGATCFALCEDRAAAEALAAAARAHGSAWWAETMRIDPTNEPG